jgi:aryl-alcohol dehydrogenase-like predicted oxidoreductase
MNFKYLGKTGVQISELCLGTMTFGNEANEEESRKMFAQSFKKGINIFDCANVYNRGVSEAMLGKFVKEYNCRNKILITTKVGSPMGDGINDTGTSRRNILLSVEESLKRLQTDWIDIYFIHRFDSTAAIEETLRALDDLVKSGKVIYTGVSNWASWQIMKSLGISRQNSLTGFSCVQPMYNLIKRQAEVEILPMCQSEGLGVLSYSPVAGGVLTGKYGSGNLKDSTRLGDKAGYAARYSKPEYFTTAQEFSALADELGVHPASLAVKWLIEGGWVSAPIIGARNADQLEAGLAAADISMDRELYEKISSLSELPPTPTDRLEEQVMKK